jgi:hypothetical protein
MWGIKSAALPGVAAALKVFEGFSALTDDEKRLVAQLIVKIAPGLAAHGDDAQALPMGKIMAMLKSACGAAWVGVIKPKKLLTDLVGAFESAPEGAELRKFCAEVVVECKAALPPSAGEL